MFCRIIIRIVPFGAMREPIWGIGAGVARRSWHCLVQKASDFQGVVWGCFGNIYIYILKYIEIYWIEWIKTCWCILHGYNTANCVDCDNFSFDMFEISQNAFNPGGSSWPCTSSSYFWRWGWEPKKLGQKTWILIPNFFYCISHFLLVRAFDKTMKSYE